jgi:predicted PurR-regulated permease PerM
MATGIPIIEPSDCDALTPDVPAGALVPPADRPEPDLARMRQLFGDSPDFRGVAIVGLFVLAVLYTLHVAQSLILPIVLAVLLDFLLSPFVRALRKVRIPEVWGAAIVMICLLGAVSATAYSLSGPAAEWVARAPQSFNTIQQKLRQLRKPVERVTKAAAQMEQATDVDGPSRIQKVEIKGPSLMTQIFGGTTSFIGTATIVIFLTWFLLAAGDLFLQKLIRVLPQFKDKKTAVTIARETERQISTYLFTSTLINAGLGVVTAAALGLLGMPNPVLWGVFAALLNFIPYVSAVIVSAVLGFAALIAFDNTGRALLVPVTYFVLNTIEGNVITPIILGRTMQLNTVALFIGLLFWWFMWGVPGAIMAVPMMAALKIFCDHIEALAPVGEFLGQ